MTIQDFIDAANNGMAQNYFESRPDFWALAPFKHEQDSTLDSGLLNTFDFRAGHANCTDAWAVVGREQKVAGAVGEDIISNIITWKPSLNVWSCALYTNLTRDFRASTLPAANATFLLDNKVDTSATAAAAVTSFLSTCLDAWCRNSKSCSAQACLASQLALDNTTLSAQEISSCIGDICTVDVNRSSNPDIAGIGVLISILIQFVIASAACALAPFVHSYWDSRHGVDSERKPSTSSSRNPVITFLDDFQRAQCCFSLGINIASLVILKRVGPSITQADKDAIALSTYTGTLPTTVIFATLIALRNRQSAYTTLLTLATWVMTLTVRYLPEERSSNQASIGYYGPPPTACGSQPPTYLCDFPLDAGGGIRHWPLLSAISGIPMLLALICAVNSYVHYDSVQLGHSGKPLRESFFRRRLRITCYVVAVLDFALSTGVFIWYFEPYISGGFVSKEWTFGQVIALTVWLPTLLSLGNDGLGFLVRRRRDPPQIFEAADEGGENGHHGLLPNITVSNVEAEARGREHVYEKKPSLRVESLHNDSDILCSGANGGTRPGWRGGDV